MVSQEGFLNLSLQELQPYSPKTLVWAAGGTRRAAILEQVPVTPPFDAYVDWSLKKHLGWVEHFVNSGVKTLFMPVLGPNQVREAGAYREHLFNMYRFIFEPYALEVYKTLGIRNKFLGTNHMTSAFVETAKGLEESTRNHSNANIFWVFVAENETDVEVDAVNSIVNQVDRGKILTYEAIVQAVYGELLPPVDMFIGFSKPHVGYWMPAFLGNNAALYFTDFPSYLMEEIDWKRIVYDYAFTRKTWQADKSGRYNNLHTSGLIERHGERRIWGVGEVVGGFWYQELDSE